MNLQEQWRQLVERLDASGSLRAQALRMNLVRVEAGTFQLETTGTVSKAAANKLVRAINQATGMPAAIAIRELPNGQSQRCYSDHHSRKTQ